MNTTNTKHIKLNENAKTRKTNNKKTADVRHLHLVARHFAAVCFTLKASRETDGSRGITVMMIIIINVIIIIVLLLPLLLL